MRFWFLALGLASNVTFAQTMTTNCYSDNLGNTHCTTNGTQSDHTVQDFINGYRQSSQETTQAQIDALRRYGEQRRAAEAQNETKTAARMIIAGDCAGAENYALGKGNIVLAREIKDYCSK